MNRVYYADDFEVKPQKNLKKGGDPYAQLKKEKMDCKTCGNTRGCAGCQLKQSKMTNNMKNLSLHLFQSVSNKWIPQNEKKKYLNELRQMIDELNQEI